MLELRHRLRLAQQARALLGAAAIVTEQLDRDLAIEIRIACRPHDAHATGAERTLQLVLAEALAGGDPRRLPARLRDCGFVELHVRTVHLAPAMDHFVNDSCDR